MKQKHYSSLSEIARVHNVHRATVTAWRDDGLLGEATADGWPASTVDLVAKDHHHRRRTTACRRALTERKLALQCSLLEVSIKRDEQTLLQERQKTAELRAAVISMPDHLATMAIIREMYFTGLAELQAEAVAAIPTCEALLVVAIDNLRKRITSFPDMVRR